MHSFPVSNEQSIHHKQEQSETAHVRQLEYGGSGSSPYMDSASGLLPKFNGNFVVQGYICDKNFQENPFTLSDFLKLLDPDPENKYDFQKI